jgi:tetratricopeptide (TPR) repeat protein
MRTVSSIAPERVIRALLYTLHLTHHLEIDRVVDPLDVDPPSDPMASLRDSALNAGLDPLRTSAAIRALGAADDHREAQALWRAGSLEAAEALASRAVQRDPEKAEFKALLGVIIAQQGGRANFKRGIVLLNEAIAAAPQNDKARVFRATVLRDAGRIDHAIRDWKAALAINPGNDEAKIALKRADVHGDRNRQSQRMSTAGRVMTPLGGVQTTRTRVQKPSSDPPPVSATTSWVLLAVIVISTLALLVVYLRMRG